MSAPEREREKKKSVKTPQLHRLGLKMTAAFFHLEGKTAAYPHTETQTHTHTNTQPTHVHYRLHTGPHWSFCTGYDLNFYKSSSARQEKTRPVAILSTTLQPLFQIPFKCDMCGVFADLRGRGAVQKKKKKREEIYFKGLLPTIPPSLLPFPLSPSLLTCRCS